MTATETYYIRRIQELEAAAERVRKLHYALTLIDYPHLKRRLCNECMLDWPCATIEAVDASARVDGAK